MKGDEEGVGNWMIEYTRKCMVRERIACPEMGYPFSEALYSSIEEWEKDTGKSFFDDICLP